MPVPIRVALSGFVLASSVLVAGCQSVLALKVGECFDGGDGASVSSVTPKPCTEPHDREVFATPSYAAGDSAYPGESSLESFAETECLAAFEPYVGRDYPSSELLIAYLSPSPETWGQGDRIVACLLYIEGQKLNGSMRESAR